MKILLLGANGQVGWALAKQAQQRGLEVIPLQRHQLDITDHEAVQQAVRRTSPAVVINAAAYTAVDQAEKEQALAYAVNRDALLSIAQACVAQHVPLLHISTDYVFDGCQRTPYHVDDAVNPMSVYGLSKWQGEEAIRQHLEQHIILRTSWVYGSHGNNFVKTIIKLAQAREELNVVDDQWGCPTPAASIANALLAICDQLSGSNANTWGTYHFTGAPPTTWFRFAEKIIHRAETCIPLRLKQLSPITTEEFPTPAVRPRYTVLNCEKLVKTFNIEPIPWESSLTTLIDADILR